MQDLTPIVLIEKGLDLRGECLNSFREAVCFRLTNEAPARVFYQGPGTQPNMTGCSLAVQCLSTLTPAVTHTSGWKKTSKGYCV